MPLLVRLRLIRRDEGELGERRGFAGRPPRWKAQRFVDLGGATSGGCSKR